MTDRPRTADRPGPYPPPGTAANLTDRVLVHTRWATASKLLVELPSVDGLVLTGNTAATGVKQLRRGGFDAPLVIDTEAYRTRATAQDPFVYDDDPNTIFGLSLRQVLQGQRDNGADAALTPTGYLAAGDWPALIAAVDTVATLDRDDVLFSLPLAAGWLDVSYLERLIAMLAPLPVAKAVSIGGQFNPVNSRPRVANLRRLVSEAGHVAVFRTDLLALDVLAHGGFAAAIGTAASLRHVIPPEQVARGGNPADRSPAVLVPDLMDFFKGSLLACRFADSPAPTCDCPTCHGRGLDTFVDQSEGTTAALHAIHTWRQWATHLRHQPTLDHRATWWRNRCHAAYIAYDAVNNRLHQPSAFEPPPALTAWASLPAWPSTDP